MLKPNYSSYRTYYHNDVISLVPEPIIDQALKVLNLDPNTLFPTEDHPNRQPLKKWLWVEIAAAVQNQKPSATKAGVNAQAIEIYAKKLLRTLQETHRALISFHYSNLSELTTEFVVSQSMRVKSNLKTPPGRIWWPIGYGIHQVQKENQANAHYYPFDAELDNMLPNLEEFIRYLQASLPELEKNKASKGKKHNVEADNIIIELCWIFRKYTGKRPHATNTGGSLSAYTIHGKIIDLLELVLPLFEYYERYKSREALQKIVQRLEKSRKYQHIWGDI